MLATTAKGMTYKNQLLDHLIDAALDAVKRARAVWMLGMVIVFVFGVAIFNAALSWNKGQIERRSKLYGAAVEGYDAVELLVDCSKNPVKCDKAISSALNHGIGEIGYLSSIWAACKARHLQNISAPTDITELRNAIASDLDAYLRRGVGFDTVGIPFIGITVAASDYGIVGGLALIVVGYWLMAMLRREHLTLNEFVKFEVKSGRLVPGCSKYEPEELSYACKRIKQYMVFSASESGSALGYVTAASFVAGPVLLLTNHLLTAIDVTGKNLGEYLQWHVILELVIAIFGVMLWIKGLIYQQDSMRLMQYWDDECGAKLPFKDFDDK